MFYGRFIELCEKKGISKSKAAISVGLDRSAPAKWKSGSIPDGATLSKLADFFGVTVDNLLEIETAPAKAAEADDEMTELLEDIRRNPDLKVLFSLSKKATPEDVRKTIKIIKALSGDDDGRNDY